MEIIIHQALYGDKNDGYALLKTTLKDETLANRICNSTDLSDRGSNWTPAIRGFPFEEFYLIMKTYSDNSPGVRSGRVFSHVLIIRKEDMGKVNNLMPLFMSFESQMEKGIDIAPIEYLEEEISFTVDQNRMLKAARGLLNGQTVVWIGQEQFPEAVATIWKGLWNTARFDFHFGINFNSTAVSSVILNFICTPEQLRSKWQNTHFFVVDVDGISEVARPAESYLIDKQADTKFTEFLHQLGAKPKSLKQLLSLERGLDTFTNLETITDFNDLFNLYVIINSYNSASGVKSDLIERVLRRIIQIIPIISCQSLNALRKIKITKDLEVIKPDLDLAVLGWLKANLFDSKVNEKDDASRIVVNSMSDESENWWKALVSDSVRDHFSNWKKRYASVLLFWLSKDSVGVLHATNRYFHLSAETIERDLESFFSTDISVDVSNQLLAVCRQNQWLKLHAKILLRLNKENALEEQIRVDVEPTSIEAIRLIAASLDSKLFLDKTLLLKDVRLIEIAGELVGAKKSLLSDFKVSEPIWQSILARAILRGKSLTFLFNDPRHELIFPFLDIVLKDREYNEELLILISKSEFADIQNYPERKEIWEHFPKRVSKNFLSKTILELANLPDFLDQVFESPLNQFAQTDEFVTAFINRNVLNMGQIVKFFLRFPAIGEMHLVNYLRDVTSNFNGLDAQKLGRLVSERQWMNALYIIRSKAKVNQSFKAAFQECCGLLSFLAYGQAMWEGLITKIEVSSDDWWHSLEDLACRLYPEGPVDNQIWKRAGGDESDLYHKVTGQEMWRKALHKLFNGGAGKIKIDNLLAEMKKDFKGNDDLAILIEIKKKI